MYRAGRIFLRLDRRLPWVITALLLAAFVVLVLYVGSGEYHIAPLDVLNTIVGGETANTNYNFVVMQLRLPRALGAWLIGAALGTSGAIVQGLTRNPLASPDLTGVTAGASASLLQRRLDIGYARAARILDQPQKY